MYSDETKANLKAQAAYENAVNAVPMGGSCGETPYRPPTMREQAEKSVGYHREQAEKHDRAAAFFRENPAFDEFIQLIRAGVIGI